MIPGNDVKHIKQLVYSLSGGKKTSIWKIIRYAMREGKGLSNKLMMILEGITTERIVRKVITDIHKDKVKYRGD